MKYQEQLTPWVVYQLTSDADRHVVTRFRRRNDADSYLKVLKQTRPNSQFVVAFDATPKSAVQDQDAEVALVEA
jgi:hypothetical protein